MARITVEDCIDKFESRFELVLIASNRARKLHSGEMPTVEKDKDKNTVIALREIADESIPIDTLKERLIEEYQTVSPIDEEDIALEYSDTEADIKDEVDLNNNIENLELSKSENKIDEMLENNQENENLDTDIDVQNNT